ncbi:MAG: GNAT family N-acetyltransferase [Symploca sp. SIO1A3]|nr:GNAT family N-acetyltransferase [Symploca sp. SIO1A3]
MTGYLDPLYAESLAEFGSPRFLPKSKGWILERQIFNLPYQDAIGCYPLFSCQDWPMLHEDLESLHDQLVSLVVVTDPFGNYDFEYLKECFKDKAIPFKEHFIIDLEHPVDKFVSSHHRRNARKALRDIRVEKCQDPMEFKEDWIKLYDVLIKRHNIRGIATFSEESFIKQLKTPGICMFRAVHQDVTIGITLWSVQSNIGYYHLGAYSELGYQLRASFALFWSIIEHFSQTNLRWLDLGAGAGLKQDSTDGLSRFKSGWSTGTKTAYLCGRIFDPEKYAELTKAKEITATNYFPAYRKGELR